ncbi:MAG: tRNA lysidine(34) synthetase TilS [Pyrinomonadaceae bacterium]|nr:tRNA lysidine(34) synthetase TilS [Pyrinomonadaceae bacterium]
MESTHGAGVERNAKSKLRTSTFARRLLVEWRRLGLPLSGARVLMATSGGADSMALLLGVIELIEAHQLRVEVTVAHLDHGLRGEQGAEDAQWVAEQSAAFGCVVEIGFADVRRRASEGDNLEQAARRARYEFLRATAEKHRACCVLTGHTMDDQAETLLLRLMRGSGTEGLGGIRPVRILETSSDVRLARPLLTWAQRADTEDYCRARGVAFRSDAMNENEAFARVRVRRKLIPLMKTFNPRIIETLARTAGILREDGEALRATVSALMINAEKSDVWGSDVQETITGSLLRVDAFIGASRALRRNALRQWLERERGDLRRLEAKHIAAVEKLLEDGRGGRVVELPGGGRVERRGKSLRFFRQEG